MLSDFFSAVFVNMNDVVFYFFSFVCGKMQNEHK